MIGSILLLEHRALDWELKKSLLGSHALVAHTFNPSYSGGVSLIDILISIRRIAVQSQPRQIVHETLS
jgi:hypothetical protein